eukprot:Colp12_sorted_trinity150504_noHs@34752
MSIPEDVQQRIQLLSAEQTLKRSDRVQRMNLVARILLDNGFTIYGGYVRDYIVRGDQANDIDVCVGESHKQLNDNSKPVLTEALSSHFPEPEWTLGWEQVAADKYSTNHGVITLTITQSTTLEKMNIDFVTHRGPDVDSDVSNLIIKKFWCRFDLSLFIGEVDWRENKPEKLSSLQEIIKNIRSKQAVMYYTTSEVLPSDPKLYSKGDRRMMKLKNAGWTIIHETKEPQADPEKEETHETEDPEVINELQENKLKLMDGLECFKKFCSQYASARLTKDDKQEFMKNAEFIETIKKIFKASYDAVNYKLPFPSLTRYQDFKQIGDLFIEYIHSLPSDWAQSNDVDTEYVLDELYSCIESLNKSYRLRNTVLMMS